MVGTDGRRSSRLASEAGRLVEEARALARGNGPLAVRGALSRARAKMSGQAPSLRWVPSELAPHYDVVIVGASLPGLFLAYELADRLVARVGLLEGDRVGAGWPSRSQATLDMARALPALSSLASRSLARYEALVTEHAFHLRFGRVDVVTVARGQAEMAGLAARLPDEHAGQGPRPHLVDLVEAREAAPHLAPDAGVGALVEPDVHTVRTDLLPWDLASRAAAAGVALVERCQLLSASRTGDSWSLTTTRGPTAAPLVVDATAAAEFLVAAGLEHGSIWHRWETLTTAPVQPFLRAQVRLGGVELRQTAQGEIEISGPAAAAPPGATGAWLAAGSALAAAAVETVPPVAQLRLAARRCRNDLVPVDGLPVVGQVTGPGAGDGLYRLGGLGGDALALAPGAAEALARHLVEDESMVPLRAFEPGRWRTTGLRARAAATVR